MKRLLFILLIGTLLLSSVVGAARYNPQDPNFFMTSSGFNLKNVQIINDDGRSYSSISPTKGKGNELSTSQQQRYTQLLQNPNLQWVVRDLESGTIIAQSAQASTKVFYAASALKPMVVTAFVEEKKKNNLNAITTAEWSDMVNLLVLSRTSSWSKLRNALGDGDRTKGNQVLTTWAQTKGYTTLQTNPAFGTPNSVTAMGASQFFYDVYQGKYHLVNQQFTHSDLIFKIMSGYITGGSRSQKYLPRDVFVGGKTGTLGSKNVAHDIGFLLYKNNYYSVVVLTDAGIASSNVEDLAILYGGLFNQYIKGRSGATSSSPIVVGKPAAAKGVVGSTPSATSTPTVTTQTKVLVDQKCQNSERCRQIDEVWQKLATALKKFTNQVWNTGLPNPAWATFVSIYPPKTVGTVVSGTTPSSSGSTSPGSLPGSVTAPSAANVVGQALAHLQTPPYYCPSSTQYPTTARQQALQQKAFNDPQGRTREQVILQMAQKYNIHPAVLAAHATWESNVGSDANAYCTGTDGKKRSRFMGYGWLGGNACSSTAQCNCPGDQLLSDVGQIEGAAKLYSESAFFPQTSSYKVCNDLRALGSIRWGGVQRWQCIAAVYNQGPGGRTNAAATTYANNIKNSFCQWDKYFSAKYHRIPQGAVKDPTKTTKADITDAAILKQVTNYESDPGFTSTVDITKSKHSLAFLQRVEVISRHLDLNPIYLLTIMRRESNFNPKAVNRKPPNPSMATGILQFIPSRARQMGITRDQIEAMNEIEQLQVVKAYYRLIVDQRNVEHRRQGKSGFAPLLNGYDIRDVLLAVFTPSAIGQPEDYVMYTQANDPAIYVKHQEFDVNPRDGKITRKEYLGFVRKHTTYNLNAGSFFKTTTSTPSSSATTPSGPIPKYSGSVALSCLKLAENLDYPIRTNLNSGSPFGWRYHPIHHDARVHAGMDVGAKTGEPVLAPASGKVTWTSTSGGCGNGMEIDHGNGVRTAYCHFSKFGNIPANKQVTKGQIIGYVGNTGGSTAPHLHFVVKKKMTINGKERYYSIDPVVGVVANAPASCFVNGHLKYRAKQVYNYEKAGKTFTGKADPY